MEVARLIARPDYVDADFDVVKMSMAGSFRYGQAAEPVQLADFNVFHRYAAGFPWRSHALWIMTQMVRWRQLDPARDLAAAAREIYRPDIYRQAAEAVGVDYPLHDYKTEGKNSAPWTLGDASREIAMGPDLFLDGRIFDPQDTESYIRSFESNQLAGGGLPAPNSNDGTA
jgi:nitrate/nitrite transport system substrate-binding protein